MVRQSKRSKQNKKKDVKKVQKIAKKSIKTKKVNKKQQKPNKERKIQKKSIEKKVANKLKKQIKKVIKAKKVIKKIKQKVAKKNEKQKNKRTSTKKKLPPKEISLESSEEIEENINVELPEKQRLLNDEFNERLDDLQNQNQIILQKLNEVHDSIGKKTKETNSKITTLVNNWSKNMSKAANIREQILDETKTVLVSELEDLIMKNFKKMQNIIKNSLNKKKKKPKKRKNDDDISISQRDDQAEVMEIEGENKKHLTFAQLPDQNQND